MAKNILKFQAGTTGAGVGSALGTAGQNSTQLNYSLFLSNSKGLSTNGVYGIFDLALGQMQTPHAELNSNNAQATSIRQGISSGLKNSGNPYARAAGYAYDIMDKTGGMTDASKELGTGNDNLNMASSILLPGFGYFTSSIGSYKMSDTMRLMSNSYSGSYLNNLDAQNLSGGKYLFGRNKAKNKLAEAERIDGTISNIKYNADQDKLAQLSMAPMIGQQNMFALQGGYQQNLARAAKYGAKLEKAQNTFKLLNTKINPSTNKTQEEDELFFLSFKQGGQIEKEEFIIESFSTKSEQEDLDFFASLIISLFKEGGELKNKSRTLDELIEYAIQLNPRFVQRLFENPRMIEFIDNEGNKVKGSHYLSWGTDDEGNAIIYPSIMEDESGNLKYYGNDAYKIANSRNDILILTPEEADLFTRNYKIHPKTKPHFDKWEEMFGNKVLSNKQGGELNVIPEGALHAHKHHMEGADNFTKKGIPVVSEEEGGELELQAEIERNEIIFRLEVTQKLEELYKKYKESESQKEKDELAIEAGKLLTYEILENTEDRTGLIEQVE